MRLTVGADPELFVKTPKGFISGHVFELGTKDHPLKTQHGAVQVDGLALEFNVQPSPTRPAFIRNVRSVLADLNQLVTAKDETASLVAQPTVTFGADYINGLPDQVKELGCNPDFNAYTMDANFPPDGAVPFRTGAGHVHLGYRKGELTQESFQDCCALVRELDFYLGLPSLSWDSDKQRRELYGAAGAFRPKAYGLEYRVLSNKWVSDPGLIGYIFDQTKKCYTNFCKGRLLFAEYGMFARECVNHSLVDWRRNTEISDTVGKDPV